MEEIEQNGTIGFAKNNDGTLLTEFPIEVFGDMVLLENSTVTSDPRTMRKVGELEFTSETHEHGNIGGWVVVAVGPLVSRVKVGDLVGNPIGNSVTSIQHPLIAHRIEIDGKLGEKVLADKTNLDYVYSVVNQQLIAVRYN